MKNFRTYTGQTPAKFQYQDRSLVLTKGMIFQLEKKYGASVIKDGFRYPINPKLVSEFVRRSEKITPSNEYVDSVEQFDKLGHTLVRYVELQARKLSNSVDSGFRNNSVYAKFNDRAAIYALRVNIDTLSAQVLVEEKQQTNVLELNKCIRRIANRLREKFGYQVGEFKSSTSHVGNISMPWGEKFSGIIYSYSAKYSTAA